MSVRIAIVGSTKFRNPFGERLAKNLIATVVKQLEWGVDWVVSGGAHGVDSWAAMTAHANGVSVIEYLPKNPRWEPEGFKERNILIAEDCTQLIRISCEGSKTYGSGWTADYAESIGKPVSRYKIPVEGNSGVFI